MLTDMIDAARVVILVAVSSVGVRMVMRLLTRLM
jgi:hypothetical protein